jgi:hypothetical protein
MGFLIMGVIGYIVKLSTFRFAVYTGRRREIARAQEEVPGAKERGQLLMEVHLQFTFRSTTFLSVVRRNLDEGMVSIHGFWGGRGVEGRAIRLKWCRH